MTSGRQPSAGAGLFRFTAFRTGLLAGVVGFLAAALGLHLWLAPTTSDGFNVDVLSAGADVSRAGGAALVIRSKRGTLTQTCHGLCDDLRYQAHDDENDYEVRVLDPRGGCVACDQPRGAMGGYGAWSHRWRISGVHPLKIIVNERIGRLPWKTAGEVSSP